MEDDVLREADDALNYTTLIAELFERVYTDSDVEQGDYSKFPRAYQLDITDEGKLGGVESRGGIDIVFGLSNVLVVDADPPGIYEGRPTDRHIEIYSPSFRTTIDLYEFNPDPESDLYKAEPYRITDLQRGSLKPVYLARFPYIRGDAFVGFYQDGSYTVFRVWFEGQRKLRACATTASIEMLIRGEAF